MFSERGFPGKPRTHAPLRFLSRLASVFCFCVLLPSCFMCLEIKTLEKQTKTKLVSSFI